ncbi:MAG: thiamine pyrophosphate-dependent dehydrogenase E1 component subunit alpha [Deltaproteobacteria bacterium]
MELKNYSHKLLIQLLFDMLRIRKVQLQIESLYHLDGMKTPVHLYIGQEAVAVGVCANLLPSDYVSSSHRSHGHYLAKGGDLKALIAELYCRTTGCSRGHGGSMHLVDTSVGHMGSSSIVGGGIPIGTGLGLAIQMRDEDRVSAIFFGDGAADEGVLYESVNFAVLKKLPVIFVYENNQYSVCSSVSARQAGEIIFHKTPADLMMSCKIDGNHVTEVYEAAQRAVRRAREKQGPSFIECVTYRVRGHAGAGSDEKLGYRVPEEIRAWDAKCPVHFYLQVLMDHGVMNQEKLREMDTMIDREVNEAFRFAQESPLPERGAITKYLFCD